MPVWGFLLLAKWVLEGEGKTKLHILIIFLNVVTGFRLTVIELLRKTPHGIKELYKTPLLVCFGPHTPYFTGSTVTFGGCFVFSCCTSPPAE